MQSILGRGVSTSISILVFAFLLTVVSMQFLNRPGWIVFDWLQRITALPESPDVALVLVDQHSLDQLANADKITFPFPRQLFGLVNSVGARIGARGVLYDILFTEPSMYGIEDDELFAKSIQDSKLPTFMPASSEKGFVKEPIPTIRKAVTGLGGVHFKVDVDGVIRRAAPHLPGTSGEVLSLPEVAYQSIGKAPASDERLLRFYRANGIPFVSFYDLILAYRALESGQQVSEQIRKLSGRMLVIGYSAPGLHDLKPIPTDNEAPGLLVPATALANRISGVGVSIVNPWIYLTLGAIFLLAILLCGTLIETPKLSALIVGVIFPVAAFSMTFLFWKFGLWFNPFPLLLGVLTAGVAQLLLKFYAYWVDRRKFAKSLEYSMSPEMVRLIRTGKLEVERYGEQREITILFCDIAGFAKLSEILDPKQLVAVLNRYSDAAVELIFENKGYVDKFIGDAVMAFWGAPVPQTDHAVNALEVAIAFDSAMQLFNAKVCVEYPHFPGLKVRVGLHTGTAIVGNIGAKNRHNYTAIGDGVNLASRLESLAKAYACFLVISEEAVLAANALDRKGLFELDTVVVKGRTRPTRIYTYVSELWLSEVSEYKSGLSLYYEGQWKEALSFFERGVHISSASVMAERCRRGLLGNLTEWNEGVWNHEIK